MEKSVSIEISSKSSDVIELSEEDQEYSDEEEEDEEAAFPKFPLQSAQKGAKFKMRIAMMRNNKKIQMGNSKEISDYYTFVEKIGEGAFGKVYRAIDKRTQKERAIKLIYKKDISFKK